MKQENPQSADQPYNELVTGFQNKLYAFISALMAGDPGASDVLQETNLVLWEKASSYDTHSSFAAWAYRIAHFQVLAHRKRQHRDHRLVFSDDLVSTLAGDFQKRAGDFEESFVALQNCLGKLAEPHRDLIRRRYEQEQSVAALATTLGRKANSVAAALYRIRNVLLKCIERTLKKEGFHG